MSPVLAEERGLAVNPSPSFVKGAPASGTNAKTKKQSTLYKIIENIQGKNHQQHEL
jgi:hypothetical protein